MRPSIYHMTFDRSTETHQDVRFEKRRAFQSNNCLENSFAVLSLDLSVPSSLTRVRHLHEPRRRPRRVVVSLAKHLMVRQSGRHGICRVLYGAWGRPTRAAAICRTQIDTVAQ
ncbi:unnamed protein product, partial [Brenthis ino]